MESYSYLAASFPLGSTEFVTLLSKSIDFQKGTNVVSLKTIDPTLKSYSGNKATNKILDYREQLDREIKVNGKIASKVIDVRIPPGTTSNLNISMLEREAAELGIKLNIKEF